MASTDARPVPLKNTAFRAYFGIFKNDGTLITGATGLDSEVSKDGAAFADCTNEATEISQGVYYLDLTSTEMNADSACVIVKSTSTGAVPVILSLYPEETGDINVDVTAWLGTACATPTTGGVPEVDVTHMGGSALSTTAAQIGVNIVQISDDAVAAQNLEAYCDGTTPQPVNITHVISDPVQASSGKTTNWGGTP